MRSLKDLGLGKHTNEIFVADQLGEIVQNLQDLHSKPISVRTMFNDMTKASLWHLITSDTWDEDTDSMVKDSLDKLHRKLHYYT